MTGSRYLCWWDRIDSYSHRRPLRWLLPRRLRNLICDAWDRWLDGPDDRA